MMRHLLDRMPGQHVYLFSDDAAGFYQKLGFTERPVGLEIVVGQWLDNTLTPHEKKITRNGQWYIAVCLETASLLLPWRLSYFWHGFPVSSSTVFRLV